MPVVGADILMNVISLVCTSTMWEHTELTVYHARCVHACVPRSLLVSVADNGDPILIENYQNGSREGEEPISLATKCMLFCYFDAHKGIDGVCYSIDIGWVFRKKRRNILLSTSGKDTERRYDQAAIAR